MCQYSVEREQVGHGLPASSLRVVVEYLHAHLGEPVCLDDLSSVVNLSKYHLLRRFAALTGRTPARFLVEFASEPGCSSSPHDRPGGVGRGSPVRLPRPSQFSAAFRRVFDTPPAAHRTHMN